MVADINHEELTLSGYQIIEISYGCRQDSELSFEIASKFTEKVHSSSSYLPLNIFHRQQMLHISQSGGLPPSSGLARQQHGCDIMYPGGLQDAAWVEATQKGSTCCIIVSLLEIIKCRCKGMCTNTPWCKCNVMCIHCKCTNEQIHDSSDTADK